MPLGQGEVLAGKYRVDGVIGQGGMGVVVRATHIELNQEVALKVLLPEHAGNPEIVARFIREARAAASIKSVHAARIADVGRTDEGLPFMVMELLAGNDLEQELARRKVLPLAEAASYILQACEAIAEAHASGIVHRDLKPANLYLARMPDRHVVVKVLDFGISKVEGAPQTLTNLGAMMGTPQYMAPEQISSATEADARSDVWSLGVTFYEIVTGMRPFEGESLPDLVRKILRESPPPPSHYLATLPEGVDWVCERCLRREPAERFGSVAELARALAPFGSLADRERVERITSTLAPESVSPETVAASTNPLYPALSRSGQPVSASEIETQPLFSKLTRSVDRPLATDPLHAALRPSDPGRITPPPPTPAPWTPDPRTSSHGLRVSRPTPTPFTPYPSAASVALRPSYPEPWSGRPTVPTVARAPSSAVLWIVIALAVAFGVAALGYGAWLLSEG